MKEEKKMHCFLCNVDHGSGECCGEPKQSLDEARKYFVQVIAELKDGKSLNEAQAETLERYALSLDEIEVAKLYVALLEALQQFFDDQQNNPNGDFRPFVE